jgi:hypothetical protein
MTLRFWSRRKQGEYAVGVPNAEYARALVRVLMGYCWHLDMHKHKDFQPMYVIEVTDEDGAPAVLEEKELEKLPPWLR